MIGGLTSLSWDSSKIVLGEELCFNSVMAEIAISYNLSQTNESNAPAKLTKSVNKDLQTTKLRIINEDSGR